MTDSCLISYKGDIYAVDVTTYDKNGNKLGDDIGDVSSQKIEKLAIHMIKALSEQTHRVFKTLDDITLTKDKEGWSATTSAIKTQKISLNGPISANVSSTIKAAALFNQMHFRKIEDLSNQIEETYKERERSVESGFAKGRTPTKYEDIYPDEEKDQVSIEEIDDEFKIEEE